MTLQMIYEETIEPRCRHFGICGGCSFQHIPYDEQLRQKERYIRECFGKESNPIIPCLSPWRYRNKMEYSFSQAKSGEKFLGLMKRRGRVETLEECFLTSPWFIETLSRVRTWWHSTLLNAYHPLANKGLLRTLTLREGFHSKEKMAVLTVSEDSFPESDLSAFIDALPDVDALIMRRQIVKKKTPTRFEESVLRGRDHIYETLYDKEERPYHFRIRAASFFQPNTLQAEVIYHTALQMAHLGESDTLLDLYCGTGSLGIFASRQVKQVLGIEIVPEAVEDAKKNIELNSLSNMDVFQGDVAQVLQNVPFHPSVVIVDPPRVGLGAKAIEHLLKIAPQKIIYISCNPTSQAADCISLGYEIKALQPIDQFPHTPHIENIALLARY